MARLGIVFHGVLIAASLLTASRVDAQTPPSPVLTEMPKPNGTPVPKTPDGRADLSGVWNDLRAPG